MNLPNRRQRRKLAKDLGLFKKDKRKKSSDENEKSQAIGKLIHLRNLTEQRNREKKE